MDNKPINNNKLKNMKQNIWCKFFNLHKYEVIKEENKLDPKGNVIGKILISRCTNCGKINHKTIYTEHQYGRY